MSDQAPRRALSYRDLCLDRVNGFSVDEFREFLWRREEELIRSAIAFPQQYAQCGIDSRHFEAPLHRVAWAAICRLTEAFPAADRIEGGSLVSEMANVDAELAVGATNWAFGVLGELPVDPRVGLEQVVKDIFYNVRLRAWKTLQSRYSERIGKDRDLIGLQAEVVSASRNLVYDFEGEGRTAQPLGLIKWDSRDREKISVVRTGFDFIDRAAGGGHGRGELLVWGGGTSHGKSFAMQRLLRNQARLRQGALYISCEDAIELMQCRMLADFCEPSVSPKDIRMRSADPEIVDRAAARMERELGEYVTVVEHKKPTVSQVCNLVRYYRYARKVDMVIVDYLQAVTPDEPSNSKVNDTAVVISQLKKCFTECKVAGVVLTQYARQEYREGEEPSVNAAKYAGDIENEAEILAYMWKDADDRLHVKLPKVKWSRAKSLRYIIPVNPVTGCHMDWEDDLDV